MDAAVPPGGVVELGGLNRPGTTTVDLDQLPAGVRLTDSTTLTCHPDTGALLTGDVPKSLAPTTRRKPPRTGGDGTEERYRPSPTLQRLIRLRDGHCRFPGCRVPARSCDLDHVTAWPTGPTTATNLICLCRRHHRVKQRPGWTVRLDPDGVVHWTDPTGRRTTTAPVDHLDRVVHLEHPGDQRPSEPTEDGRRVRSSPPAGTRQRLLSTGPASPHYLDSLAELALHRILGLARVDARDRHVRGDTSAVDWHTPGRDVLVGNGLTGPRPSTGEPDPPPF